jgi:hypothetical protein
MVYRDAVTKLNSFEIPYGVLVPQEVDGLAVSGRIISQNHRADMWTRGQYCCMVTGQVAGTATALSAQLGTTLRRLDVPLLQRALLGQGIDIGEVAAELQ